MNAQSIKTPIEYALDDNDLYQLVQIADEDLSEIQYEFFFFGKLVNDDFIAEKISDYKKLQEDEYYCYCPECGELFVVDNPKTYDSIACPKCNRDGTLYDFRDETLLLENEYASFLAQLQVYEKGYVLRLFDIGLCFSHREYDNYDTICVEPTLSVIETAREYWHEGKLFYYQNTAPNPLGNSVADFEEVERISDHDYYVTNYQNDFNPMLDSGYVVDIIHDDPYCSKTFIEYISRGLSYKAYKTLMKYGFYYLIPDMLYLPHLFPDSAKISEVLDVDYNQVLAQFKDYAFGVHELRAARELKEYRVPLTLTNIKIMIELDSCSNKLLQPESARKTFKYLRNLAARSSRGTEIARDYRDYISECEKLDYDLSQSIVRYPSDLLAAHAKTSALIVIKNNKATEDAVRAVYDNFHQYCEWTDGEFIITMPSSTEHIIIDGKTQNHCVGNYCERVAKGEDIILFLRTKNNPEKPFYTIEIRPNMKKLGIGQCRGYKNKDFASETSEELKDFMRKYKQWFNSRPAVKTNQKRIYYKAVIKTADGRYISNFDQKTEYKVGQVVTAKTNKNPDQYAVSGIHMSSLAFAQKYGGGWNNVAILELEVDIKDCVIPNAKDQVRASRCKVLREVSIEDQQQMLKAAV